MSRPLKVRVTHDFQNCQLDFQYNRSTTIDPTQRTSGAGLATYQTITTVQPCIDFVVPWAQITQANFTDYPTLTMPVPATPTTIYKPLSEYLNGTIIIEIEDIGVNDTTADNTIGLEIFQSCGDDYNVYYPTSPPPILCLSNP
jgi:hypothetical protein